MFDTDQKTLIDSLFECASLHPKKIALRNRNEFITYDDFRSAIISGASHLRDLGIKIGDKVLISGQNSIALSIAYFAVHTVGAVAVFAAQDVPDLTLAAIVKQCDAKIALLDRCVPAMECPVEDLIWLSKHNCGSITPFCSPNDDADILFTTGTTGRKKGVILTHANALAAALNANSYIKTDSHDEEIAPLSLSHSFGLGRLRVLAMVGHTLILEPGVGIGAEIIKWLESRRATGISLSPAALEIIQRVAPNSLFRAREHLRYIEIGSASLRKSVRDWIMDSLPYTKIYHHYGLTEASRATYIEYHADMIKFGSAGRPSPLVNISICDDDHRLLPSGKVGEVVISGPMVMKGYLDESVKSRAAFCAHGFRTGDLGYLDADGYLFLQGRQDDLINVGGRKVVPEEVEELIELIDGVREAVCVGESDPITGQRVKAYLVSDSSIDAATVATHLRQWLEEFKIPRSIDLVDSLPRTASGKIQRSLLRN